MTFCNYTPNDYEAVCDFLIALNRHEKNHINWNWARFEWMAEHPEFDRSSASSIGLWREDNAVVGAAIYDMYFGEAFCAALPEYFALYPEILDYACRNLSDENGLGIAVCDDSAEELAALKQAGFLRADQDETVMSIALDAPFSVSLPSGLYFSQLDPAREPYDFQWLLWQGFDHGEDRSEFEREDVIVPQIRKHFNPQLSVTAVNETGDRLSYCCLWYSEKTDYAYVEPVCTVPSCRGKGIAKAVIYEALNRAKTLGAEKAYVISDSAFYKALGFHPAKHFTFYWKK